MFHVASKTLFGSFILRINSWTKVPGSVCSFKELPIKDRSAAAHRGGHDVILEDLREGTDQPCWNQNRRQAGRAGEWYEQQDILFCKHTPESPTEQYVNVHQQSAESAAHQAPFWQAVATTGALRLYLQGVYTLPAPCVCCAGSRPVASRSAFLNETDIFLYACTYAN